MTVAVAALLMLGLLLPPGASAAVKCRFDPTSRVLSVTAGESWATLRRVGNDIRIFGFNSSPIDCGGSPTVTNTNQIEVFTQGSESLVTINLSGGPFVPGATPDPGSSSEIEFTAGGNGSVNLIGGPGADRFRYMSAQGQIGLNLNAGPDDEDLDLVLLPDQDTNFTASGGPGADTIDVVGHPQVFVAAAGNRGNDTLSSRGSAVRFSALEGNAGRDRIIGGRSNDLIAPGAGPDIVEAGSGPDQIFLRHDKRRDRVDCGPGRDRVFGVLSTVVDPLDHLRSCERVKGR